MRTVQLILSPAGEQEAWRVREVQTGAARGPSRILVAPGALVMSRDVEAVGRSDAQARAATLATLAPDLAMAASDCVCVLAPVKDGRRTAHVMARRTLDALINGAKAQGHSPDAVIADFALLPRAGHDGAFVSQRGDSLVRTETSGFACQRDLLPMLLGGRTVREIAFEEAAAASISQGLHATLPNLMASGGNTTAAPRRFMPVAAGLAAAAALSVFAALPWLEAVRLDGATAQLRAEAEAVARRALPGAQRIVNPLAQLREANLPRALAAAGLGNALTVVEGLGRSPGVAIARLSFDGEAVVAHVGVPSTALLQPLRDHLTANGLQLVETPGLSEPNSIPVELTVTAP